MDAKHGDFDTLPNGWAWARLSDVAGKLVDGSHNPPPKQTSGIPMLSARNVLNNEIRFEGARYISKLDFEKESRRTVIAPGDILLTIVGTIGRSAVVQKGLPEFALQRSVALIKTRIEPEYLCFLFQSPRLISYFFDHAKGTAQKGLYLGKLKDVPLPIAPLAEQKRIVAKIKAVFNESRISREAVDKALILLRWFRRSLLARAFKGDLTQRDLNDEPAQKLLERIKQERDRRKDISLIRNHEKPTAELPELPETWIWATIGDLETFIGSGITPRGGKKVYRKEGIPFIRSQNVYPNGLHLEDVACITPRVHAKMKRTQVRPSDVLLNITGASIGRSTYIPEGFDEANVNQHVCIIRTGWWMIPAYLSHFLNSIYGQDQIFATESGVTREGLNYTQIRSLRIPLAPLREQKCIATKIEEVFSLAYQIEAAIMRAQERANRIDQAVLFKAFRGELVPQDPRDERASILLEHIRSELANVPVRFRHKERNVPPSDIVQRTLAGYSRSVLDVLRETGCSTVEQVLEASGLCMDEFWDELKAEINANRVEQTRRGNSIYLKVKD